MDVEYGSGGGGSGNAALLYAKNRRNFRSGSSDSLVGNHNKINNNNNNTSESDDDCDGDANGYEKCRLIYMDSPSSSSPSSSSSTSSHYTVRVNRHSRRYTSSAFVAAIFLFILFLIYIPLSNHAKSQRIVPIPGWSKNTTRDTTHYVLPHLNTTLIDPVHVCSKRLFLLIVVCSSSVNFELRQAIRETWGNITEFNYSMFAKIHSHFRGNYLDINFKNWRNFLSTQSETHNSREASQQNFSVKIVFLIGQTLDNKTQNLILNESEYNGDLIQESFLDSYNNLTLKTIMMLKWVNDNCSHKIKYLMKCDDDTFVNVPNLLHVLLGGTVPVYNDTVQEHDQITVKATSPMNRISQKSNLLIGSRFCRSKPIGNVTSKWYTPVYMYEGNTYPNYLSGIGYVMSMDVAHKLYNASLVTPLFHLEDVYLTGICAKVAKIKPKNHQLFSYTSYKKACELRGMVTKHELTATKMHEAYDFVTNSSLICPKPDKHFRVRKVKTRERHCS